MTRHDVEVFRRQMSGRPVFQHRYPCLYPVSPCKTLASCPADFQPYVEPDDQVLQGPILTSPDAVAEHDLEGRLKRMYRAIGAEDKYKEPEPVDYGSAVTAGLRLARPHLVGDRLSLLHIWEAQ